MMQVSLSGLKTMKIRKYFYVKARFGCHIYIYIYSLLTFYVFGAEMGWLVTNLKLLSHILLLFTSQSSRSTHGCDPPILKLRFLTDRSSNRVKTCCV